MAEIQRREERLRQTLPVDLDGLGAAQESARERGGTGDRPALSGHIIETLDRAGFGNSIFSCTSKYSLTSVQMLPVPKHSSSNQACSSHFLFHLLLHLWVRFSLLTQNISSLGVSNSISFCSKNGG